MLSFGFEPNGFTGKTLLPSASRLQTNTMAEIHLSMEKANLVPVLFWKPYTQLHSSLPYISECLSQFLELLITRVDLIVALSAFQILTAGFWLEGHKIFMTLQEIVTFVTYARTARVNRPPDGNTNPASCVPRAQEPGESASSESWMVTQCSALHQGERWQHDPTDPTHLHNHWAWSKWDIPLSRNGCKSSGMSKNCHNTQLCRNSSLFPEV